jgi:hypothetical protein
MVQVLMISGMKKYGIRKHGSWEERKRGSAEVLDLRASDLTRFRSFKVCLQLMNSERNSLNKKI